MNIRLNRAVDPVAVTPNPALQLAKIRRTRLTSELENSMTKAQSDKKVGTDPILDGYYVSSPPSRRFDHLY